MNDHGLVAAPLWANVTLRSSADVSADVSSSDNAAAATALGGRAAEDRAAAAASASAAAASSSSSATAAAAASVLAATPPMGYNTWEKRATTTTRSPLMTPPPHCDGWGLACQGQGSSYCDDDSVVVWTSLTRGATQRRRARAPRRLASDAWRPLLLVCGLESSPRSSRAAPWFLYVVSSMTYQCTSRHTTTHHDTP